MRGALAKVLAIATVDVRLYLGDRTNLFFVFVFPLAIVLVIGLQFGGSDTARLGVVGPRGETATALLAQLEADDDIEIVDVGSEGRLVDRIETTDLDAGLVLPADLDARVAQGGPAEIGFVLGTTQAGMQLDVAIERELARLLAVPTAVRAATAAGADPARAADVAEQLAPDLLDRVGVRTVTTGEQLFPEGTEGYDVAAPSQLVLFTFVTGLAGSAALIQARQLGISARMLATPTSARTIIGGEALGRFLVGVIQALYILVATAIAFGIDWGDPLGAAAVVLAVAAVSASAAMCFGTLFHNPEQANGIGVVVALVMAALGGAMMPIELFSDTLASIARLTPHYWALDAFAELVRHDGTLRDIGRQIGVLAGWTAVLLALASWRMRVVLTRGR